MEHEIKTSTVKREHFELRRSGAFTYVAIQGIHVASIYRARNVMVNGVLTSQHSPVMVSGEQLGDFPTRKDALEAIAAHMNQPAPDPEAFRVDAIGPERRRERAFFATLDDAASHVADRGYGRITTRRGKLYLGISANVQREALKRVAR